MAGLDLSHVARVVADLLDVSEVAITRPGVGGPQLDDASGDLTDPAETAVYAGQGAVLPITGYSSVPDPDTQRIVDRTGATYRLLVPVEESVPARAGDLVRVVAFKVPNEDVDLLSRTFEVVDAPTVSSMPVIRFIYLKAL